ncbi:MAG TPA: ATP-binding protein [Zeimonas sp.]
MKPARWDCCSLATLFVALMLLAVAVHAAAPDDAAQEPSHAQVLLDARPELPDDGGDWREVALPDPTHNGRALAVWLRFAFDAPAHAEAWGIYLPYLYGGGAVYLNRMPIASVAQTDAEYHVRWERPRVFPLPDARVRAGDNTIHLRIVAAHPPNGLWLARPVVGPLEELNELADRRVLWIRTMPQITVGTCLLFALLVGYVWWSRRREVLYGLFGLAVALWGVRTLTFVVERLPAENWWLWRTVYHGATGGFIVTMAVFAMRFAGLRRVWFERALFAYWLVGPLALLASGGRAESVVGRLWTLGMIPIGLSVVVFVALAWYRHRTRSSFALLAAVALAVASGVHDYLVAWHVAAFDRLLPGWPGQRIFLMHFGADLLLVVMAGLLTARFVRSLGEVEELNETLERRVAARETELAENYRRLGTLERERAAADERHRIMRDLHDGLGSRLFTSLSRAERGSLHDGEVAETLRACIDEMRVALEALSSDEADFGTALGNLLFRWEGPLREAGVRPVWNIDVADEAHRVPPHVALQILRILQEALTNVLKHSRATEVRVDVQGTPRTLSIRIEDNGGGMPPDTASRGRGLANMRTRARRIGASLRVDSNTEGTRLELRMPGDDEYTVTPLPGGGVAAPEPDGSTAPVA